MVLQSFLYLQVIVKENCFISLCVQTKHVLHKKVKYFFFFFFRMPLVTHPGIK